MIRLGISGCRGRMGQRITQLALADPEFSITALLERPDHPEIGQPVDRLGVTADLGVIKNCDVLIDFTQPAATIRNLGACAQHKVKMVIGTTGFTDEEREKIKAAAGRIPIVLSSNMSVGVNIVFKLAEVLAQAAPPDYNVQIVEAHHVHKKDAPSGTAKTLAQIIEADSGRKVAGIESIRQGEIVGDHQIIFESSEDVITLGHHAKTRDIFAKGALVAAKFLGRQASGLFSMQDVLGLQ